MAVSMPDDFFFASITEINQKLKAKEFSAVELTKAFCGRLEQLGPRYNALALSLRVHHRDQPEAQGQGVFGRRADQSLLRPAGATGAALQRAGIVAACASPRSTRSSRPRSFRPSS